MDWTILGIAPTDDKKAITAAYRAKLKTTNPEEKPDEFKALRAAYEEALRLAEQPQSAQEDPTPIGLWIAKLSAIYSDFSARIDQGRWQELLNDDVCTALDTRPAAEEELLKFLMEHFHLPQAVWQLLDDAFGWQERMEELCEVFPREFIEQGVIGGIRIENVLPFELFEPGLDGNACDEYRHLYYRCSQVAPNERGELLDQMEALSESHPYGRSIRFNYMFLNGEREAAIEGLRRLAEDYPDDARMSVFYANACLDTGHQAEAAAIARRILEREPDHFFAKRSLSEAQYAMGQLTEAKETIYELMHDSGDDPITMEQLAERLREINADLITKYQTALESDPGDSHSAIELAWCHLQCECPDQAMDVALKIDGEKADPFDYHNLMGKLYHNIEMFPQSAEHMQAVVDLLRTMEPDGTEKTEKRLHRLPEMLQILGSCLMQVGREEEARAIFAEVLTLAPDDVKVLTQMGNIHYFAGEFEQCLAVMRHLTDVSPVSWFGHLMQAMCLYKLHRDGEAYDAVNRAQTFQGGDLSLYVLKMQILLRNGVFEEVRSILDYLKEAGAPEDLSIEFIRAQLLELEDKDPNAAFRSYQAIARKVEDGENLLDAPLLYYRMAFLMGKQSGYDTDADRQNILALVEKGLSHDALDADCLEYKAWLLKRGGKLSDAIEMYKTKPIFDAKRKLMYTYHEDLDTYCAECLAACQELLEEKQTPELCFYAASCCRHTGDWKGTERYSRMALELDPGDIDAWNSLAYQKEYEGSQEEALENINRALDSMWSLELFYDWLLHHKIKLLCRLGRHAEALTAVDDAMSRADYNGFPTKFDICCQFGLFDQAEVVLAQWARMRRGDPDQIKATGHLHLLRRKMLKATFAYGKVKHQMNRDEEMEMRCQLAALEANHKRLIQLLTQQVQERGDPAGPLMNLALALRWAGDAEQSRKTAEKSLTMLEEKLSAYQPNETLYRTQRAMVLALLDRVEEAREELEHCRKAPLCEFCNYGRCKDADIYEAYIEELLGNHKRAKELYLAGQKNWPDELDFVSGETRIKKKKG